MKNTDFVPASLDVALLELRTLRENSEIRSGDYQPILQALIPGGTLLATFRGARIAGAKRQQGLDALARIADQLHESSHLGLWCAIHELMEKEAAPR